MKLPLIENIIEKVFGKKEEKTIKIKGEDEKEKEVKLKVRDLKRTKLLNLGGKAMFLILDSSNFGTIYTGFVEDGFFNDEKNERSWFTGAQQPIMVKSVGGYTPFYILRYDSPFPSENLHPINPEFLKGLSMEEKEKLPTPKLLYRLLKMVILANVIKPKKKVKFEKSSFLVGLIVGAIILWYLIQIGIIK